MDRYIEAAKAKLREHFTNERGDPIQRPFYQRQLECFYENKYFDDVIVRALKALVEEGFLTLITQETIPEFDRLKNLRTVNFYANSKAVKDKVERKKAENRAYLICEIVNEYSSVYVNRIRGRHLENLVRDELRAQQFKIVGRGTNEYNGKKWEKTDHNLDFIAELKGSDLTIGVEVKNTLGVIEIDEVNTKIEICKKLGIVPVFACRWLKPRQNYIYDRNGFSWVFKTQMYPLGQEKFVQDIFDTLSVTTRTSEANIQFPVTVRTELPPKSVKNFEMWIQKNKDNPPKVKDVDQ